MLDILIKNARIITMDDSRPVIDGGCVGILGGRLAFVCGESEIGAHESEARRVIDASGNIVMPGLINTHAHTAMCVMRGFADDMRLDTWLFEHIFPVEARLTERAVLSGVRLGIAEMLASGTTSFSDMYFFEPKTAEIVLETGIRANLCNGVIALDESYDFESDRAVIEMKELIANWHNAGGGRIKADAAIHAEYTSPPWVRKSVHELAAEHKLITQLHLSETKKEVGECALRHGGRTPARVFYDEGIFDTPVLAAHGVFLSDDDMRLLAEKGVSAAHCPVSNLKLASGIARVKELIERGVNVSLGTDGCASNNSHDLFEEIKLAALLAKGSSFDPTAIPAYTALKMATVNGAKAQGRSEVGMLKPGFEADLIMLDVHKANMRPLHDPVSAAVYSAKGSDVSLTIVQGRVLYENGEFTTIDIEKVIREVDEFALPIVRGR
ncbi:MAG: amidohydrolase [Clostridia bacterium]|nr:amidohydrolase [Clostridia bacterium]